MIFNNYPIIINGLSIILIIQFILTWVVSTAFQIHQNSSSRNLQHDSVLFYYKSISLYLTDLLFFLIFISILIIQLILQKGPFKSLRKIKDEIFSHGLLRLRNFPSSFPRLFQIVSFQIKVYSFPQVGSHEVS